MENKDIILCIAEFLAYPQLVLFTSLNHEYMKIRQSKTYINAQKQYHEPDDGFDIESDHMHNNITYVRVDRNIISCIWYDVKNGYQYRIVNMFMNLDYSINIPFVITDKLYDMIRKRFINYDVKKLIMQGWIPYYIPVPKGDEDECQKTNDWIKVDKKLEKEDMINKSKAVYYAFKYFKKEIMEMDNE